MKRRVSFLLTLILAVALAFALSSCGECEHVAGAAVKEITTEGNCRTAEKYDEVVYCTECGEEMSRTSVKGETGDHVPGEAVYENIDLQDCTKGGTADKVIKCSVQRCGVELEREEGVAYNGANDGQHKMTKKVFYEYDGEHKNPMVIEYCSECAYVKGVRAPKDGEVTTKALSTAQKAKHTKDTCTYCNYLADTSKNFKYVETVVNGVEGYKLLGLKDGATAPKQLNIDTFEGKPVFEIAPGAFKNLNFDFVRIGSNVKIIGAGAFEGSAITKVIIYDIESWCNIEFGTKDEETDEIVYAGSNPLSVAASFSYGNGKYNGIDVKNTLSLPSDIDIEKISAYAFAGIKVNAVYVPASVTEIGTESFSSCASLLYVHISDSAASRTVAANAFAGCESLRTVYADSLAGWLKNSFANPSANPLNFAGEFFIGGAEIADTITIPANVTAIPSNLFINLDIVKVVIPEGVKVIGAGAFSGCSLLTTVEMSNVEEIGDSAFRACSSLASVKLPNTVTTIKDNAFAGCSKLVSVEFGSGVNSIGAGAFMGCSSLKTLKLPANLTSISQNMFANCSSLVEVEFGAGLTTIASGAFANCVSITKFEFTDNITTIADGAFSGCAGLSELKLNANLKTIGAGAFKDCKLIKKIEIPAAVTYIGLGAFEGCNAVESITVPFVGGTATDTHFGYIFGAKTYAENRTYVPYTLSDIVITGSTGFSAYAFSGCESIVSVSLPESLVAIADYAFEGCTSLTAVYCKSFEQWCAIDFASYSANPLATANELYINGVLATEFIASAYGVTAIKPYTFYGAAEILTVDLTGVTSIGNDAFSHATALTTVKFDSAIDVIGARAFVGCDSLETVIIADVADWCGVVFADAFANPLYYAGALYVGENAVTELTVSGVTAVSAYAFVNADFLTKVVIADGVETIGKSAFYGSNKIASLSIANTVTAISGSAFEKCSSIVTLSIGSAVDSIGVRAFADCVKLTKVILPATVKTIDAEAFSGCAALVEVALNEGLVSIGTSAFAGCSALTTITIPATVTVIGAHAFHGCDALDSSILG